MGKGSVDKAVILAGGRGSAVCPLASYYPKLAFPLGHAPVIAHLLNYLQKSGINEVAIVSSEHHNWARERIMAAAKVLDEACMAVSWFFDDGTKGTAGSLKQVEGFVGDSDFLVVQANLYIKNLDLSEIVTAHQTRGSGITVVVEERPFERTDLEHIEIDPAGRVEHFDVPHYSRVNAHPLAFSGVYVFHPRVLRTYDEEGYVDIKEQLLPLLSAAQIPVHAFETKGIIKRINTLDDYFRLNADYLFNGVAEPSRVFAAKREILPGVWVGKNVHIAANAYVVGPVIIEDDCTLEEDTQIIGPTLICAGTHIEACSRVRESIIWQGSRIKRNARIEYSLVADRCVVPAGELVSNALVIKDENLNGHFNFMTSMTPQRIAAATGNRSTGSLSWSKARTSKLSLAAKRVFDVVVSAVGLVLLAPLFAVLALAIKLTSRGPVFFKQIRCGKEGKAFRMHKLRTMVEDAERIQETLAGSKDVDGPVFKLNRDPRVTSVGRLLRKTSLDELPQLFNVLKGEMSLVGPRPLAIEEMKFSPSWRDIRLSVKPGITGLWQIRGRKSPRFHDWIEYDIHYVLNYSFRLDLSILLKTVWVAITGAGAK